MEAERITCTLLDAESEEIYRVSLTMEQYHLMDWLKAHDMLASCICWKGVDDPPDEI